MNPEQATAQHEPDNPAGHRRHSWPGFRRAEPDGAAGFPDDDNAPL